MKAFLIGAAALVLGAGCVDIAPEYRRAYECERGGMREVVKAATAFRLAEHRWPGTREELQKGAQYWRDKPEYLSELRSVFIVEECDDSVFYRCVFQGGGSTEVRVNIR